MSDDAFAAGDKIVHPAHGAGIIDAIEQPDILDEFNRYYVIDLTAQDMRIMIPVRTAEELGLRAVMSKKETLAVYKQLGQQPQHLPDDFKKRQSHIAKLLKEGDIEALTSVVRDMAARAKIKTYSPTEARLYEQARSMLSGEMALSLDTDVEDALARIDVVLEDIHLSEEKPAEEDE
jgi:CarD family transcriptional regulator